MAKTLKDAPLTTKRAREGLAASEVHWRGIDTDVHLGYRKGKHGGVWLVRWRHAAGYRRSQLGAADDVMDEGTLSYTAAVKAARETVEARRLEAEAEAAGPVVTVGMAAETYVARRDAEETKRAGRAVRSDTARRLELYVTGRPARGRRKAVDAAPLAGKPLYLLTARDLADWRGGIAGLGETALRRLSNDLRAALNVKRRSKGTPDRRRRGTPFSDNMMLVC